MPKAYMRPKIAQAGVKLRLDPDWWCWTMDAGGAFVLLAAWWKKLGIVLCSLGLSQWNHSRNLFSLKSKLSAV